MGKIVLNGMKFFAHHGCTKEEREQGGNYIVDLTLDFNTRKSEETDNINDTIDYVEVYQMIQKEMVTSSRLLEHLARRIINTISIHFYEVNGIKIKITKLNPPVDDLDLDNVAIEISEVK